MSTELQVAANRQNASVSTGPRTPEGKAKVSRNAIRHGIFAREVVIADGDGCEDQSAYRRLHTALVADLAPEGQMELLLVEKLAVDYWRLRRVLGYETGRLREVLDGYMRQAVECHYARTRTTAAGQQPVRPVLETYQYGDVITDKEHALQVGNVESLRSPETDLLSNENFLEFAYFQHFDPNGADAYSERDEAIPDSEWERLRQWLKALPPRKLAKLRRELLEIEEQTLAEMEQVRRWNRTFDVLARVRSLPQPHELAKICKYEAHLERSMFRNLAALKSLQATRGPSRSK